MIALVITQLLMIAMFLGFGYLIVKKEMYSLISGFSMKSEEEQRKLIESGYPQASAKGLIYSGYILVAGLIIQIFYEYAILISIGVMIVFLFGYLLYATKFDTSKSKKLTRIILILSMVFTFAVIGFSFFMGNSSNELSISNNELHISGSYGVDWPIAEITNVELVNTLPNIKMRTNGYAMGDRLKGKFRLEELNTGRLFLYRDKPPFLFIQKGDDYLFINSKDEAVTRAWYEEITSALKE